MNPPVIVLFLLSPCSTDPDLGTGDPHVSSASMPCSPVDADDTAVHLLTNGRSSATDPLARMNFRRGGSNGRGDNSKARSRARLPDR
jgi:hypothetical protein